MLAEQDARLVCIHNGRTSVVAVLTPETMYRALLLWGVRDAVAIAVAAKLVTVKLVA